MNVCLVWSGQKSKAVAVSLEWLFKRQPDPPLIDCRISGPETYPRGLRSSPALGSDAIALLCLTVENAADLWLSYQAGYLTAKYGARRLACLRYGIEDEDIRGPLARLRSYPCTAAALGEALVQGRHEVSPGAIGAWLEADWPTLEAELARFLAALGENPPSDADVGNAESTLEEPLPGQDLQAEALSAVLGAPVAEIVLSGTSYREQKTRCEAAFKFSVLYRTLRATEGQLPRTAEWLELPRPTLYRLLMASKLSPRLFRPRPPQEPGPPPGPGTPPQA